MKRQKPKRYNRANCLVARPEWRSRLEDAERGRGSYQRHPKHRRQGHESE